jgi:hypothetical protein
MPINPTKIAEWKELVRVSNLPYGSTRTKDGHTVAPGDTWYETDWFYGCSEALPLLLAEREEMLALLREVESRDSDDGIPCLRCNRAPGYYHAYDCHLAAVLGLRFDPDNGPNRVEPQPGEPEPK